MKDFQLKIYKIYERVDERGFARGAIITHDRYGVTFRHDLKDGHWTASVAQYQNHIRISLWIAEVRFSWITKMK